LSLTRIEQVQGLADTSVLQLLNDDVIELMLDECHENLDQSNEDNEENEYDDDDDWDFDNSNK